MGKIAPQTVRLVLLLLVAGVGLLQGDPGKDTAAERIAALIKQLGDDDFRRREQACETLETLGEKALPALRLAARKDPDIEIRRRADDLLQAILLAHRKSKTTGLEMVLIPDGEFQMGSPGTEGYRQPNEQQHRVRIARAFLLGAHEVTQEQYQQVMKTNPSWFTSTGRGKDKVAGMDTKRFPVESVNWYGAIEFCNALSKLDGYEPYYKLADVKRDGEAIKSAAVTIAGGSGYRLPTETEWEYACRACARSPYHYGFGNSGQEANIQSGPAVGYGGPASWNSVGRPARVGSYPVSDWGLYDMHGNVAEWCWDCYDADYYGKSPVDDPPGPAAGVHRVLRGGSWQSREGSCRSASRFWLTPDESNFYAGFRVARSA